MKACPFCGYKSIQLSTKKYYHIEYEGSVGEVGRAECWNCGCCGPELYRKEKETYDELKERARVAWETRYIEYVVFKQ